MDKNFKKFAKRVMDEMVPAMHGSAYVITIAPKGGEADVKLAVEIGFAILMDKPLIVFVPKGRAVGERLARIADHVLEADMTTEAGQKEAMNKLRILMGQ